MVFVLIALTLYLQYALWFTRGGVRDVEKLNQAVAEQKTELARLKERNRALAAEVIDLKQGLDAVEERARSEMGMIKRGEVFFRMTDPNVLGHNLPSKPAPAGEPVPEPPLDPLVREPPANAPPSALAAPVAPGAQP